jgi:hypothetical protein
MAETETSKVLNIRGISEGTHLLLREYAELSNLTQAKAINQALEIALAFSDVKLGQKEGHLRYSQR